MTDRSSDPRKSSAQVYSKLHRRVLDAGTWMAPSAYEVAFLSTAHEEVHVDRAIASLNTALAEAGEPTE